MRRNARFAVVASCAATLAACGGGGSGSGSSGVSNPPPPAPSPVAITQGNALQVSAVGMVLPSFLLQFTGLADHALRTVMQHSERQFTAPCESGGEADFDFVDVNLDGFPGDGDSIAVTYRNCIVPFLEEVTTGSLTFSLVSPSQGSTLEDKYFKGTLDASGLSSEVRSPVEFEIHLGLLEELHRVFGDVTLVISVDGKDYSEKLEGFSISKYTDLESARNAIEFSGTVVSELLDGTVVYEANDSLSGFLDTYPEQGRFEMAGADGSRVAVVPYDVPGSTSAEVEYDANGDGSFETLPDQEFWTLFAPDYTWSYAPTNQIYIRPYDENDFWFVGTSPAKSDVVSVNSSLRIQFSRPVDPNSVPATVTTRRELDEPPYIEFYDAQTDIRGAAIVLRPLQQLRHGSHYVYPSDVLTVSDALGNQDGACCGDFDTRDNLSAVAKPSAVYGVNPATVALDGSQSASTGESITSYAWTQPEGTPALVTDADQALASLQIPVVAMPEVLKLQLTVTDANGEREWDTLDIHAFPDKDSIALLYFYGDEGEVITLGREWLLGSAVQPSSIMRNSNNGIWFQTGTWNLELAAPGDVDIQVGSYEGAERYGPSGSAAPQLSLGGDGRGCNTSTGRFDVLEISYGGNGDILSAAVDFEQYCDGSNAKLTGYLRYGSDLSVPVRP